MKIAIIHDTDEIYISIPEDKTRELLKKYNDLTPLEAFEKLIEELKRTALNK